jgi:hypothetical protein
MPTTHGSQPPRSGLERVRHELLSALHFGKLSPGDRAPSVRGLADLTGMNRKTIHRAYTRLAREGLLDLRPGSGTYIAESAPVNDLLGAVDRARSLARDLRLAPGVFASFLDTYLSGGLRELPLAVVECNLEQIGLIAASLRSELGIAPRPVLLSHFAVRTKAALEGCWGVVTTECHYAEVRRRLEPLSVPAFRVAFDSAFPRRIVEFAHQGRVILVVQDRAFEPVFLRALQQIGVEPEVLRRLQILDPASARAALRQATTRTAVYVSPLIPAEALGNLPRGVQRIPDPWLLDAQSVERLKATLALDVAARGGLQRPRA